MHYIPHKEIHSQPEFESEAHSWRLFVDIFPRNKEKQENTSVNFDLNTAQMCVDPNGGRHH